MENAIREADDNQHLRFYSEVSKHLSVDLGIGRRVKESEVDFKTLDKMEMCVVEADKGMGLVILDIERLISADDEMVIELGGAKLENKTCEDIMEDLKRKIDEFESNLDLFSRKFLNIYYEDRVEQLDRAMIPFLKLKPKLHKLSSQQLEERNQAQLKFRPVVDSSRGPLNGYSKSLMDYMRELIRKVCLKFFHGKNPIIKNGQEVLEVLKSIGQSSNIGRYFVVADLSSAYTYIFLENLLVAMKYIGKDLEIPECCGWGKQLIYDILFCIG